MLRRVPLSLVARARIDEDEGPLLFAELFVCELAAPFAGDALAAVFVGGLAGDAGFAALFGAGGVAAGLAADGGGAEGEGDDEGAPGCADAGMLIPKTSAAKTTARDAGRDGARRPAARLLDLIAQMIPM